MAEIKKYSFERIVEEFDPYEKSTDQFEVLTGKFSIEDLILFFESGMELWALENLSYRGRPIIKIAQKIREQHLRDMRNYNVKLVSAKLKRMHEILTPEVNRLISTYREISVEDIEKYPLVNLTRSDFPDTVKEEIKNAITKKYNESRKNLIETFNSISQNKIDTSQPLYSSGAISRSKMRSKIEGRPDKVILAVDISASTVVDNLHYFVQYLARQVKNHIENLLCLPLDVIFFHHDAFLLDKKNCIKDFGGTLYEIPFEYCLEEARDKSVDFILISDGMPNDDSVAIKLARRFPNMGINYFQIILLHPLSNIMQSYSLGSYPYADSELSYFRLYEKVFGEICKNAGGSQIIIKFPEFLYYMIVDLYDPPGKS